MKRTILTALAALLLATPAVQAQKVNKTALLDKIAKSDAEIADAKKGAKSATWLNRGKAFYEAATESTKTLFVSMEPAMMKLAIGDPTSKAEETLQGVAYEAWVYPYFTAYLKDGKLATWKQTKYVLPGASEKAIEAYNKALELDPKAEAKVKEGLKQISDYLSQIGNTGIDTGSYVEAADAYALAFEAQSNPAYGTADPSLLYYAGYLRTVDGSTNPASFVSGADYLTKALKLGYADEEGNVYYYLFHCFYGQKDADKENLQKAKQALLDGISKFPKNERILDGLMQLYTSEQGVGDPKDLIALIEKAIAENPANIDLWFGRGRIFYALKNSDESIASFKKVVELKPELFDGHYYLGVFYTIKGDDMNNEVNKKQYSSQAAYDADLKEVNTIYAEAVPHLEKAHEIKPEDINTLEFLKQLTFRLRDEQGMQEKYNKYNELYKKVKGE